MNTRKQPLNKVIATITENREKVCKLYKLNKLYIAAILALLHSARLLIKKVK